MYRYVIMNIYEKNFTLVCSKSKFSVIDCLLNSSMDKIKTDLWIIGKIVLYLVEDVSFVKVFDTNDSNDSNVLNCFHDT